LILGIPLEYEFCFYSKALHKRIFKRICVWLLLVFGQGFHDVPHANIHSCIASRGACTPFVANTPGLATHTAAQTANFSQTGLVTFDSKVKLPKEQYTIIAHIRFLTEPMTAGVPSTKWDVAIGTSRDVVKDVGGVCLPTLLQCYSGIIKMCCMNRSATVSDAH
jgi:hypothetical protein